jgi:outer membrane protein OmpA-like peptidoglycan-associated protein
MRRLRTFAALMIGGSLMATAGCRSVFAPGPPVIAPAPVPVAPTYLLADVIGGYAVRLKKARAAGSRPLNPAAVADYVNRQEYELRRETAGTGVDIIRSGDRLLLRLPSAFTFDVGSSNIRPQAISTLYEVALTLKTFNQTFVDVLGHTDSTGKQAANQILSERRAQAVAKELRSRVAAARVATRGYAASQPIADNSTDAGRAMNRRVEIKLVPIR